MQARLSNDVVTDLGGLPPSAQREAAKAMTCLRSSYGSASMAAMVVPRDDYNEVTLAGVTILFDLPAQTLIRILHVAVANAGPSWPTVKPAQRPVIPDDNDQVSEATTADILAFPKRKRVTQLE